GLPGLLATAATKPSLQHQPFEVAHRGAGGPVRCLSLADAVTLARDGDRIVIAGDGPYATGPVRITGKRLTIQAAPGSRPVLRYRHPTRAALLFTDASLTLEGLTFEVLPASPAEVLPLDVVRSEKSVLRISHCRFLVRGQSGNITCSGSDLQLQHCEIDAGPFAGLNWVPVADRRLVVENC